MFTAVWTIGKTQHNTAYHIVGVDSKTNQIKWTNKRANCLKFDTEQSALNFIKTQLKDRKDVYVLCVSSFTPFF